MKTRPEIEKINREEKIKNHLRELENLGYDILAGSPSRGVRDEIKNTERDTMANYYTGLRNAESEGQKAEMSAGASYNSALRTLDQEPNQFNFGDSQEDNAGNASEANYRGRSPQSVQEQRSSQKMPWDINLNGNQMMSEDPVLKRKIEEEKIRTSQMASMMPSDAKTNMGDNIPRRVEQPIDTAQKYGKRDEPHKVIQKQAINKVATAQKARVNNAIISAPLTQNLPEQNAILKKWEESALAVGNAMQAGDEEAAKAHARAADDYLQKLEDNAKLERDVMEDYKKGIAAIDEHVNRNRFFDEMPLMNKVLAAVSLFVGSRTQGADNAALSVLDSEIQKDIQNQKLEYERKGDKANNLYKISAGIIKSDMGRASLTYAIINEGIKAKLEERQSGLIPLRTRERINAFLLQRQDAINSSLQNSALEKLKAAHTIQAIKTAAAREGTEYARQANLRAETDIKKTERTSQYGTDAKVRNKQLSTAFEAIIPRKKEAVDYMEDLANSVNELKAYSVSNPYYSREREMIKAKIERLSGRLASIVNDRTGGVVVAEAKLAEKALNRISAVDQWWNAITTKGGATERANELREWANGIRDASANQFNSAFMKQDGSTFSRDEIDQALGFTKVSEIPQERK